MELPFVSLVPFVVGSDRREDSLQPANATAIARPLLIGTALVRDDELPPAEPRSPRQLIGRLVARHGVNSPSGRSAADGRRVEVEPDSNHELATRARYAACTSSRRRSTSRLSCCCTRKRMRSLVRSVAMGCSGRWAASRASDVAIGAVGLTPLRLQRTRALECNTEHRVCIPAARDVRGRPPSRPPPPPAPLRGLPPSASGRARAGAGRGVRKNLTL